MKKLLLGAVAAAAMAAPGLANAETSGGIALTYANTEYDGGGDFDAYSLGGNVVHGLSNGWTIQLDGRTTLQDWSWSYDSHGYAAFHGSTDLGGFEVGGFAGMVNYYGDGGTLVGVEARTALGNFSVDGSISLTDFQDNGYDGTTYRAGGAYFFSPNLALTGGASFTNVNSWTDFEITELSLGGAYQFANNVELFGGYTNGDIEWSGASNETDTLKLGVRFNLNGGTLQDNANNGAWGSAEAVSDIWMRW